MKILFTTEHHDSPSTILNANLLKYLNDIKGVTIDFYNRSYENYDVVLFMGYDFRIEEARSVNENIKIGVIDPRPRFDKQPLGADFILANGIEMKDWYLKVTPNIYTYYIYPYLQRKIKKHSQSDKIIIGYHGNLVHLDEMYPRITSALEALAAIYQVELWAMYNIENLGKWSPKFSGSRKITVKHIDWSEENYDKYMSHVDIGIIPGLTPINEIERIKSDASVDPSVYLGHSTDYLVRYKVMSNAGRALVFAQYGIPVVGDILPSLLQLIEDNCDGFTCYSSASWYNALKRLSDSPDLRMTVSKKMAEKFEKKLSLNVLNRGLIDFLSALPYKPESVPCFPKEI